MHRNTARIDDVTPYRFRTLALLPGLCNAVVRNASLSLQAVAADPSRRVREDVRAWVCAAAAVGAPIAVLWTGQGERIAFSAAALALVVCGRAPLWLSALALLPLFQLLPGEPPAELAEAMKAANVSGPGTIATDPSALWVEVRALAACLGVYALARTAASSASALSAAVAGMAVFGCFEAAVGLASSGGATPAAGTLIHRGQYAALLELTFGAGCGLAAAAWAGKAWRERLDEKALLAAGLGLLSAALSLAGIAASLSRTGILAGGAAVAAAAWLGRKRSWALTAAAVVFAAISVGAPHAIDRFEALAEGGDPGRNSVWADSVALAGEHWALGVGLGSFPSAFRRSAFYLSRKSVENAHSDYLEWLVELGAPAALALFGAAAFGLTRIARTPLAAGLAIGLGAVLLHATVDLPLQLPGLAALTSATLGLAGRASERATRLGGVALGALILAFAYVPHADTPADLYADAGAALARGDEVQAEELYRQALDRNLRTAPAWLRLAELERAAGGHGRAILFARAARSVEPFTVRTEWPLAELELASGEASAGIERLSAVVAAAPDLLDAALHTASRSGAPLPQLENLIPPGDPEAAGRYLAFLVRNQPDVSLPEAYARLGEPDLPEPYRGWLARTAGFQP